MSNTVETVNIGELVSASIDAAQKAGEIIRSVWKSGKLDIKDKGVDDPFTIADVQSQQLIMGLLKKKWPTLSMVGEEDCVIPDTPHQPQLTLVDQSKVPSTLRSVPLRDVCVFIDPLDATKEYTLGNLPAVCTLIGVSVKGEAIAGVVYQPFVDVNGSGRLIWGIVGGGVSGCTPIERNDNKLTVAVTASHSTGELERLLARLKADNVIRVGGAGYKALLVLEGKADVYFHVAGGTKKWDTCAPEAILRAVGGDLTDLFGAKLPYTQDAPKSNGNGLICSLKNHRQNVLLVNTKLDIEQPQTHSTKYKMSSETAHTTENVNKQQKRRLWLIASGLAVAGVALTLYVQRRK